MAQAKRVHSTPRRAASKIKTKPAEERSLDLSYRCLEARVCDLDWLCEITLNLVIKSNDHPGNLERASHAVTIAEIMQDRMREFKNVYYDLYSAPLKDGEDYVVIPTVSRR
jgi:hypothetical protein